jgi:hypothetical protein
MKADRVTLQQRYTLNWRARFDRGYSSRTRKPTPASVQRIIALCNSDKVDVYHYVEDGCIGLEIYRKER